MQNLIATAVAPLKDRAIEHATAHAQRLVEMVRREMTEAGWDLQKAAPYPRSFNTGRTEYLKQKGRYDLFRQLTTSTKASRNRTEPDFAVMNDAGVARLFEDFKAGAAASYDAYVAKLTAKIGKVTSASLDGEGTWVYSNLTVTTEAGERQVWRTQMIINVSILGKVFNQWPTRRVKG